jgi:hypothetical protein
MMCLISLDPRMEHFESRLEPGTVFSASYLSDDVYHQFRAGFERLITDPIRAIVLNKPDEVLNIEQRMLPRTTCSVPARVDIRKTLAGTITDISPKGCRIEMPVEKRRRIHWKWVIVCDSGSGHPAVSMAISLKVRCAMSPTVNRWRKPVCDLTICLKSSEILSIRWRADNIEPGRLIRPFD